MKKINATDYPLYLKEFKLMNKKVNEMNATTEMINYVYANYLLDNNFYNKLRKEIGNNEPLDIKSLIDSIIKDLPNQIVSEDTFNFFNKHSKDFAIIMQVYAFLKYKDKWDLKDTQQAVQLIIQTWKNVYEHLSMIENKIDDFNSLIENHKINVLDIKIPYPDALTTIIKAKLPKKQSSQVYKQLYDELKQSSNNNICEFTMSPLPLDDSIDDLETFKYLWQNNSSVFINSNIKDSEYEYEFTFK